MDIFIKIKKGAGVFGFTPDKYYRVTESWKDERGLTSYNILNNNNAEQTVRNEWVEDIRILRIESTNSYEGNILIKYFDKDLPKLELTEKGDCIDLRVSKVFRMNVNVNSPATIEDEQEFPYFYKAGDVIFFKLGVGMKFPDGVGARVYPRSGMFKNFGFILTNGVGVIDNSYCHEGDEWGAMVYCTRDGVINYGDRILQFEPAQIYAHKYVYTEVGNLEEGERGSYGSTGVE